MTITAFLSPPISKSACSYARLSAPAHLHRDSKGTATSFTLVNVTLIVRDENGAPVPEAWVRAFSEDWGVMYPHFESWGLTDNAGAYRFRIPVGKWLFIASSGWRYANTHLGEGFFIAVSLQVREDLLLELNPDREIEVAILDEECSSLPVDEVYALLSSHIPAIPPAIIGRAPIGSLTLHLGGDINCLTLLVVTYPRRYRDAYLLVGGVQPGLRREAISAVGAATISFTAYEADGSLSDYWNVEFRLPDLYLGNWVFCFQVVEGRTTIHISPMNVVINPRFIPPGWYYYFEHIALELEEGEEYEFSLGGRASFRLWVLREPPPSTQLWFDVRDEFGNVLAFYSDPTSSRYIRLRVFENGVEVYDENIGMYIPGTLFYGLRRVFSSDATFTLEVGLGPLGGLGNVTVSGLLYGDEYMCKYRTIEAENFTFHIPIEYFWNISGDVRDSTFIEALGNLYTSIGWFTGEELELKPHEVVVNFEWCGVAGTDFLGFGLGVARWPLYTHPGWLGVLSHELGHLYSFTPPLSYWVECPWFCEPLATYLGIEGIAAIYGHNTRLWYWGTHPGFFDYIAGDEGVGEIERMQFIFFYIHRIYGPSLHKLFFNLWSRLRERLPEDFDDVEAVCTLYSYLAKGNLAWLFRLAGFNVSDDEVHRGLGTLLEVADFPAPLVLDGVVNVTFIVGETREHGLFNIGARTVDVLGAIGTAYTIGFNSSGGICNWIADVYATYIVDGKVVVNWSRIDTRAIVSVGGPGVNLLSLYYNGTCPFAWLYTPGVRSCIYSSLTGKC
ncbi:MAG: hypothetical protein DRK00_10130, partial [Thermoprotei archaeon]